MIKEPRFQNCSKQTHRQNPGERAAIPLATELLLGQPPPQVRHTPTFREDSGLCL